MNENKVCVPKQDERMNCTETFHCLGNMRCTQNQTCQCDINEYFNAQLNKCDQKTSNNTACMANTTCRDDLGLTCQNSLCQCYSANQVWFSMNKSCINYLTYNETTPCESSYQCQSLQNLICDGKQCI
jgi:hypothetical protein